MAMQEIETLKTEIEQLKSKKKPAKKSGYAKKRRG